MNTTGASIDIEAADTIERKKKKNKKDKDKGVPSDPCNTIECAVDCEDSCGWYGTRNALIVTQLLVCCH